MLANARVLGYVFNPLTVYWCHRPDGELECVVAEVHNTYRERHCYLLRPDAAGRAETAKEFYVSPFLTVAGDYRMALPVPDRAAAPVDHAAPARRHRAGGHRGRHPAPGHPGHAGPDAAATPAGAAAHLRPDPPPRHRAVAAPAARRPPAQARPAGGRPVSTEPISAVRRSNKHFVPRPNEGVWPGLATPPSSPARARVAETLFTRAVRSLPVRVVFPGRATARRRRADLAGHADRPPGRVLPPARRQLEDRVRRVVHGRRLDLHPARRPAHPVRGPAVHADLADPAAGLPALRGGPPAARGGEHRRGLAGEHPAPLRPVQRAVRAVPGRDDVLLVGLVRARQRRPGRRPAPQDRRHPRPGRRAGPASTSWRSAPAGAGWPPGPRSAAPGSPR